MSEYISEAEAKAMQVLEIEANDEFLEALARFRAVNETMWVFDPNNEGVISLIDRDHSSNRAYVHVYPSSPVRTYADFECDDLAIYSA